MISFAHVLRIGTATLIAVSVPLACVHEDDSEAAPDDLDASVDSGDAPSSDIIPGVDTGAGASACSTSKLCITATPIDTSVQLMSVWGSSATDVWAVGSNSTILHYDGVGWKKADRAAPDGSGFFTLRSVWSERADDIWIVDGNGIRHGTGWNGPSATEWSFFAYTPIIYQPVPTTVHGRGNTVWLTRGLNTTASGPRLLKFEGWADGRPSAPQSWDFTEADCGFTTAVSMSRLDEAWTIANSICCRASLSSGDSGAPDAAPPTWQFEVHDSRTTRTLSGVWGDDNTVWLVGEAGTLRRMTRSAVHTKTFEIVPSPVIADLYGVFGFGVNDAWAVGEAGTVVHWDGTSWRKLSTPFDDASEKPRLLAVWGSSPADVWIAGNGTMLHLQENGR